MKVSFSDPPSETAKRNEVSFAADWEARIPPRSTRENLGENRGRKGESVLGKSNRTRWGIFTGNLAHFAGGITVLHRSAIISARSSIYRYLSCAAPRATIRLRGLSKCNIFYRTYQTNKQTNKQKKKRKKKRRKKRTKKKRKPRHIEWISRVNIGL